LLNWISTHPLVRVVMLHNSQEVRGVVIPDSDPESISIFISLLHDQAVTASPEPKISANDSVRTLSCSISSSE
jgi:hypothetical protein